MELLKLLQSRRSIRKYTDEHISDETLEKILQAGLLAPSSRAIYPVELVAVRDKEMLSKLSECKAAGAAMLKDADAAIVVVGDTAKSDAWIEDCSITMTLMMLEATEQGVGNCWVQCRGRQTAEGTSTEERIRALLSIPENYGVLAILSLGMPAENPDARTLPDTNCAKFSTDDSRIMMNGGTLCHCR